MALVYEVRHFTLKTLDQPHVSRSDGGHVVIDPKVAVEERTRLTAEQAFGAAHPDGAQAAGLNERPRGEHRVRRELDVAGDKV